MVSTQVLAVGIVAILAVSAVAAYVVLSDDDDDREIIETGRLVIYGNANNDDYLDDYDVDFIQDIIDGNTTWNSTKNPFADTNTDGKITDADVTLLEKFINKEEAEMYYYTSDGSIDSVSYPIAGNLAVNFSYGLDAAVVLDCYDRIVAADNRTITQKGNTDAKYPGLSKITNVGTPWDDAEALIEACKEQNIVAIFGYSDYRITDTEANVTAGGGSIDGICLSLNHKEGPGSDKYGSILTLGIMLGCEDRAYEFMKYVDDIADYLDSKDAEEITYVMPEYEEAWSGSSTTTYIMTISKDGWMSSRTSGWSPRSSR